MTWHRSFGHATGKLDHIGEFRRVRYRPHGVPALPTGWEQGAAAG